MSATPLPLADLDLILQHSSEDLRAFDGAHVLLTGGTGFVGSWLVESIVHACRELDIQIHLTVPSRSPAAYLAKRPHLSDLREVDYVAMDIRDPLTAIGHVDAIVHAATEASAALNEGNPLEMLDVITSGMANVLSFASGCGEIPVLFTSSGAVYGRQPPALFGTPETYLGAPDPMDANAAYHEGKRLAELQGAIASTFSPIRFVAARMFAFLGPLLPLDAHFAAGNFIGDILRGRPIHISGDGTPRRSYQHPIDMCISLWALLARGRDRTAYNVGSDVEVSIAELAHKISVHGDHTDVHVARQAVPGEPPARYVPNTDRIRKELAVHDIIGLDDAIARTIAWHRAGTA